MFNEHDAVLQKNIELLSEGYWYDELPPIIDVCALGESIIEILKKIENNEFNDFKFDDEGLICEFNSLKVPPYIYNDGMESITYFEYKKNGALREMQIPNLKYYISFIYNTLYVYNDLFVKIYGEEELEQYVSNSNSYILFNELFYVHRGYDGKEEIESGIFAVRNNKQTSQLAYEGNNVRYLNKQGSKLYTVKVDIESFYPNVYTHYLQKIKTFEPFKTNFSCDNYFDFLDYYNMKTNNNQTKGIATGVFSSTLSAELLMLCVDYEINNVIGNNVEYIRYVDDMTFFSDSLEEIYTKIPLVQRLLNKYRLRINNNKTEEIKSIYNMSYVDLYEIKHRFVFLDIEKDETVILEQDIFYDLKGYISQAFDNGDKSKIKAILSLLKTAIYSEKIIFADNGKIKFEIYMVSYMLQLSSLEPILASRCYKVIIAILNKSKEKDIYSKIITEIQKKNEYVNIKHCDTIMQIWHYYVLSQYDNNFLVNNYLKLFEDEINPIILATFVRNVKDGNREIFNYIKSKYSNIINTPNEPDKWKESVMFSKWWLPLFVIYLYDGKDYSEFYSSQHFNIIYRLFKE